MKLKNKKTNEEVEINIISDSLVVCHADGEMKKLNLSDLKDYEEVKDYKEPKMYWAISMYSENGVDDFKWSNGLFGDDVDKFNKEIGNYFDTREEAEKAVEKLKAWKRLKDKGVSFEVKVIGRKWYLEPKAKPSQRTFDEAHDIHKDIMIVFGGEE